MQEERTLRPWTMFRCLLPLSFQSLFRQSPGEEEFSRPVCGAECHEGTGHWLVGTPIHDTPCREQQGEFSNPPPGSSHRLRYPLCRFHCANARFRSGAGRRPGS